MDYTELTTLSDIYLEDSYVLGIEEGERALRFRLDAVLTPDHPDYDSPAPGQKYCMVRGWLIFDDVARVEWLSRSTTYAKDATGEPDQDNIDYLKRVDGYWWAGGDWGEVHVYTGTDPYLTLDASASGSSPGATRT